MKIAYCAIIFPKLSETFVLNEILELLDLGFDIRVYSNLNPLAEPVQPKASKLAERIFYLSDLEYKKTKKTHIRFALRSPFRYIRSYIFAWQRRQYGSFEMFKRIVFWAEDLKTQGFEHIHAHFASVSAETAMLLSMLTGIPYSFTIHAYDIFVDPVLLKEKFGKAKFVVAISQYNKDYIKKALPGIDPDKIKVIHCGIDLDEFKPVEHEEHKAGLFKILSVGRLVEKKGFKYLIDACAVLMQRGIPSFHCDIIGEGPEKNALATRIQTLGLNNYITLHGEVTNPEIILAMKYADVFILPCIIAENGDRDGIPVSLMEAMASSVLAISTRVSGIPELIKSGSGFCVDPRNVEALLDALIKAVALPAEERRMMNVSARSVIENDFNLEKETMKLARLFEAR